MLTDGIFQIALILATFLCSLVAGLLFVFALVVMPGIRSLNDREFIRAFQVIDGVIQNNQPIFVLIIFAALAYLLGVQLPTVTINIPLNNKLQTLDVGAMNETTQKAARKDFEPRWNRWNSIRAAFASLASALLIILLFIL